MTLAEHLSQSNEHYSPAGVVHAARVVLGAIDLDPASCALANETVRADRYFTRDDDGLSKAWWGRVFLNPPGGRTGANSVQKRWWRKLAAEYGEGRAKAAVYLGFNMQILQTSQVHNDVGLALPMHFPMCIPARRLRFVHEKAGRLVEGRAPAHASVIVFLPPKEGASQARTRFLEMFSPIGMVFGGGLP